MLLLVAVVIGSRPSRALLWDNSADLSDDFRLQWSIKGNEITFELQVATLGYVGIGFSATGAMDNADMAIGWVDQGQVYFQVSSRSRSLRYGRGRIIKTASRGAAIG